MGVKKGNRKKEITYSRDDVKNFIIVKNKPLTNDLRVLSLSLYLKFTHYIETLYRIIDYYSVDGHCCEVVTSRAVSSFASSPMGAGSSAFDVNPIFESIQKCQTFLPSLSLSPSPPSLFLTSP